MEAQRYLGVGLYTFSDAARLMGVRAGTLRRWAHGYRHGDDGYSPPVVQPQFPELKEAGVLTFLDFVELFLVARWRQAGVSMQTIRRNARLAKERFDTNHPFAVKRFHVSGKELIAETVRTAGPSPATALRGVAEVPTGLGSGDRVLLQET